MSRGSAREGRGARMRKVNELVREVVADEVGRLKDPRIGFVTITGVDTAPNLRSATVYFSVLGSRDEQRATGEALEHAHARIQAALAGQVRLKYTPRLHFEVDEAVERGMRINAILHDLEEAEAAAASDGAAAGAAPIEESDGDD